MSNCIRIAKDSDAFAWNQYVLNLKSNPCYFFYEWKFLIEEEYKVKALLLIATDKANNVVGILFSYHKNHLGSVLYTPEFCVASDHNEISSNLIAFANEYCQKNHLSKSLFTTGHLPLGRLTFDNNEYFFYEKTWTKNSFILDLRVGSEKLWENIAGSVRNTIRKAEKAELKIARGFEYLDDFYALYADYFSKKRLNLKPFSFFKKLMEYFQSQLDIWVCLHDGEVISGTIFFNNGEISSYLYNVSHPEYRSLGANDLVIWEATKFYIEKGFSAINLGESARGSGAFNFKMKRCKPRDAYYYSYLNKKISKINSHKIFNKISEKAIITLCNQKYLPLFLLRPLLIKRGKYGRLL